MDIAFEKGHTAQLIVQFHLRHHIRLVPILGG